MRTMDADPDAPICRVAPRPYISDVYVHTCMHACMHTYILTYMHTYMHACMHTYLKMYVYIYIYTYALDGRLVEFLVFNLVLY